jgi:predicted RNase H-like HicB family nuclease
MLTGKALLRRLVAPEESMKRVRAVFERDSDGYWLVHVPALQGCHTYGRTLDQARERIREAIRLFIRRGEFEVVDDVRLPAALRRRVDRARRARLQAEAHQSEAQKELAAATSSLKRAGLSLRDAGDLLGISRQRVHQVASRRVRLAE